MKNRLLIFIAFVGIGLVISLMILNPQYQQFIHDLTDTVKKEAILFRNIVIVLLIYFLPCLLGVGFGLTLNHFDLNLEKETP